MLHYLSGPVLPSLTIKDLELLGLDSEIIRNLKRLINKKSNEEDVVITFLYALLNAVIEFSAPKQLKRIIRKKYKDISQDENLYGNILKILKHASIPITEALEIK